MDSFTFIFSVSNGKSFDISPYLEDGVVNKLSPFIINRTFSLNSKNTEFANELNLRMSNLPIEHFLHISKYKFRHSSFVSLGKSNTKEQSKMKKILETISKYYDITMKEASTYMNILSEDDVKMIFMESGIEYKF